MGFHHRSHDVERRVVRSSDFAARGAEHAAAVFVGNAAGGADGATLDIYRGERGSLITWRRAHVGQGTAAVHIAVDGATVDGDLGVLCNRTC